MSCFWHRKMGGSTAPQVCTLTNKKTTLKHTAPQLLGESAVAAILRKYNGLSNAKDSEKQYFHNRSALKRMQQDSFQKVIPT
jgi:hypothetical protein